MSYMMARTRHIFIFIMCLTCVSSNESYISENDNSIYHNEFAVHIPSGSKTADIIAEKYDYINTGQIGSLDNFFLFRHKRLQKRSVNPSHLHYEELFTDPEVTWVEQQVEKRRVKRDFDVLSTNKFIDSGTLNFQKIDSTPLNRVRRQFFPSPFHNNFGGFSFFKPAVRVSPIRRGTRFSDPLFSHQWYLSEGAVGSYDMNVSAAWAKGYTGKGVVISILDDGIQHNHPDLSQNYDPLASTDINDNDADPMPRDNGDNKHGTRCAGEVASVAFNDYCGVGIAYNASVGGVRMLDGTVNDAVEARAISLNPDHIDIYSASWGPEDDGKTVDGPGPLAKRAFINGVIRGRHGKGSIFVWASGNGGRHTDNCNCDGYTNSIFTLSISSASQRGLKPWYLEECSSTLASTYSSGTPGLDLSVATADMDGNLRPDRICTLDHTGTSASAPLAAGLCALALEANPDLTWRDMQHIVVRTSRREPLMHEEGWFHNAVGRYVSHKFGYGLMDAGAMVTLARRWRSVPPQHVCQTIINRTDLTIPTIRGSSVRAQITTDGCAGTSGEVRYLEHVQAIVSLRFLPRGNINIKLISPSGTSSTLLFERPRDVLSEKFDDWPFLSVHFWGEKAAGTWILVVTNGGSRQSSHPGVLVHWQLILHGTQQNPEKQLFSPSAFTLTPAFPFGDLGFSGSDIHKTIEPFDSNVSANIQRSEFDSKNHSLLLDSDVCHSECVGGCSGAGPQNCKACRRYSLDGECLSNCPDGTYGSENKECLPCHGSCAQCIGPRQNQCSACSSQNLFVEHLGICVEMCPSGYYADKGLCLPCGNQCSKCSAAEYCLNCAHNLLLLNGSCYVSCPKGMFEGNLNTCNNCDPSCETCVDENSGNCASCRHPYFLSLGRCLIACPKGSYGDEHTQFCRACPLGCSSCTSDQCTSCNDGWRLKSGICVALRPLKCKINEFLSKNTCHPCHSSCLNCIGPDSTECLYCKTPSMLLNNQCVDSCPNGYYSHKSRCLPCPHGCSSCDAFEVCTSCDIKFHLFDNKCLPSCPDGYYSDKGVCVLCEPTCKTCWGPQNDQCLSCPERALLLHSTCRYSCPESYFRESFTCHPCYRNCKTCNDSGIYSCTSCHPYFTLDGGMCLECRSGRYFNATEGICSDCHESCVTCSGGNANSCTSCQAPFSLHSGTNTCRACCEKVEDEEKDGCCICSPDTGECLGSGTTDKRRIAMSLRLQESVPPRTVISTISLVLAICLGNVVVVGLVYVALRSRSTSRKRTSNSYTYQPLPTTMVSSTPSGSYSYPVAMSVLAGSDCESEDDEEKGEEYQNLITRT